MKVLQISSLFYGVIEHDDGRIEVVSEGFPTFEMAMSMLAVDDI